MRRGHRAHAAGAVPVAQTDPAPPVVVPVGDPVHNRGRGPPDEEADFIAAVAGSWQSAQEALTAVDVREAEAWQATDRAAIAAAVEAGVGFEETNVRGHTGQLE